MISNAMQAVEVHAAPEVELESFDGNTLNYHYFMAFFREVVKCDIDNLGGRLTRLIK